MKSVIIIAIAFVLLIPLSVFAQEESLSELTARLDAENLEKAKQTGSIVQPTNPNNQQPSPSIDCPDGTYQGLDNQRNPACRDIKTNQIVDPNTGLMYDSQTGGIILDNDQSAYVGIGIIVLIIIIGVIAAASRKKTPYKDLTRKHFSESDKENVLRKQNHRCIECNRVLDVVDFDHIDADKTNNDISNCQALCPNCHAKKSRKERSKYNDDE